MIFTGFLLVAVLRKSELAKNWHWKAIGNQRFSQGKSHKSGSEVSLCESMSVVNWISFRTRAVVKVSVCALSREGNNEQLNKMVQQHPHAIKDSIRTVIASADYEQITDPELFYVTSKIAARIEPILGKGLMSKIVVPHWRIDHPDHARRN